MGPKPAGCFLCRAAESWRDDTCLVVHRGEDALMLLNRYPYACGHMLVAPVRHVSRLSELAAPELAETSRLLQDAESLLERIYQPAGLNVGLNLGEAAGAGLAEHLHWHMVPRWGGDANFLGVVGETRVLPETLDETLEKLRRGLRR